MKLYLHIGIEKTGTSSLQNFLHTNREKLLNDYGILYPTVGLWRDNSHHNFSFSMLNTNIHEKNIKSFDAIFNELKHEILKSKCDSVFISSEIFRGFTEEERFKLFENTLKSFFKDIHLIVFLRDQPYWLISMYNQLIKDTTIAYNKSFKDFCREFENQADFYGLLNRWIKITKKEKVHIFKYFEKNNPNKKSSVLVISDFLGLDLDKFNMPKNRNISLNRTQLEFIKHFNRFKNKPDEHKRINHNIIETFKKNNEDYMFGRHAICNIETKKLLHDKYKESNKKVNKEFLNNDENLFPEINEQEDAIELNALNISNFTKLYLSSKGYFI